MKRIPALAASFAIAAALTPAHAGTRTATESYVGSSQLTLGSRCRTETVPVNVGMACFTIKPGDDSMRITVQDDVSGAAGFFYIQSDASGECVGSNPDPTNTDPCPGAGIHCGQATVAVLPGAVELTVWVDGATGPIDCLVIESRDSIGAGFTGTVEVKTTF